MRTIFKINSGERDDADMLEQNDFAVLTQSQKDEIDKLVEKAKLSDEDMDALYKWLKVEDLHETSPEQFKNLCDSLKRKAKK
jgi:hypothetical protein